MPGKKLGQLRREHKEKRREIRKRLGEFSRTWEKGSEAVFAELAFCLCTPQSNALQCDAAVNEMIAKRVLDKGDKTEIARIIAKKARFHRNKASYIVAAHNLMMPGIKQKLLGLGIDRNQKAARGWLAANVKGIGMKEASHFLRNIGFGSDVAILDRHILRNLLRYGAIREMPQSLSPRKYLAVEEKMRSFSKRAGIPLAELDLLFWSRETGKIFK